MFWHTWPAQIRRESVRLVIWDTYVVIFDLCWLHHICALVPLSGSLESLWRARSNVPWEHLLGFSIWHLHDTIWIPFIWVDWVLMESNWTWKVKVADGGRLRRSLLVVDVIESGVRIHKRSCQRFCNQHYYWYQHIFYTSCYTRQKAYLHFTVGRLTWACDWSLAI